MNQKGIVLINKFNYLIRNMGIEKNQLLDKIQGYEILYPSESHTAKRFIELIQDNKNCFERTNAKAHLTGSAWVVNHAGTHALLTHHRKLNMWLQLGGHADGEIDLLRVAMREAYEESGLEKLKPVASAIFDMDIHTIPARGNEAEHEHFDIRFALQVSGSEVYCISDESHDLSWVDINKISNYSNEQTMLRMAHKWLQNH